MILQIFKHLLFNNISLFENSKLTYVLKIMLNLTKSDDFKDLNGNK